MIVLIAAAALAFGAVAQSSGCSSPVFFGHNPHTSLAVASMIEEKGGLPKSSAEVMPVANLAQHWSPVTSWHIEQVSVANLFPLWQSILDDDPIYGLDVDIRVEFADGDHGFLRWSTWRYGLVLCPAVLGYGDGPPGKLEIISLNNG